MNYMPLQSTEAALALTKLANAQLQQQLDQEELNGMAIMECRDYIKRKLGANAAVIGGGLTSPFFDDIVKALVDQLLAAHQTLNAILTPPTAKRPRISQAVAAQIGQQQQMVQAAAAQQASSYYNSLSLGQAMASNVSGSATTITSTATGLGTIFFTNATTNTTVPTGAVYGGQIGIDDGVEDRPYRIRATPGRKCIVDLPDGAVLKVAADGSYVLEDKAAKVTYRACLVREFNPFINASDKVEDFIDYCGAHDVAQDEMLDMPLKLFIGWLMMEAAKADGEPEPQAPMVTELKQLTDGRRA